MISFPLTFGALGNQYMGAELRKIINPIRDWRIVISSAQSESTNALIVNHIPIVCGTLGGNSSLH